jgi:hypothetical protein
MEDLFLITPVNDVFRRDVELADPTLLDPNESDAIRQGEWLRFDSAGKAVRATAGDRGAFQVFTQKGDLSGQSIGKTAVLQLHEYEAETVIFDDAFAGAVGDPLSVDTVTVGGVAGTFSGLRAATSGDVVYGHVTKLPADNNGKLRFQKSYTGAALP